MPVRPGCDGNGPQRYAGSGARFGTDHVKISPIPLKTPCNTPPCFAVYTVQLVLKWLEETIGGLEKMALLNQKKAHLLYNLLTPVPFRATAEPDSRSLMNVTFRLPSEELEQLFIRQALENGIGGLKGHGSVGGCRASLYNAVSLDAVEALTEFMATFEKKNG